MCSDCDIAYQHHYAPQQSIVRAYNHDFLHTWLYAYSDIRSLMVRAKYNAEFGHFRCWAQQCAGALVNLDEYSASLVLTSIPSSSTRMQQRGYDHGAIFARSIAGLCGLRYQPLLLQSREFAQTQHSRADRLHTPRYMAASDVRGYQVLVIDDVATTRASLRNAVATLRRSGAKSANAFTLAYGVPKKIDTQSEQRAHKRF